MDACTLGRTRGQLALICIAVAAMGACSSSHSPTSASKPTINSLGPSTSEPRNSNSATSTTYRPGTTASPTATSPATTPNGPPATTPPTTPSVNPVVQSEISDAVQLVRSRGFTPRDVNDLTMPPLDGLHVIIATATHPGDGHTQQAFFFDNGHFIRTDASPSAEIQLAWRNNTTIALSYAVYKANEPMCCPAGGAMIVRYRWTGTQLKSLDPVPSATARR
jgi:hypothetical protein